MPLTRSASTNAAASSSKVQLPNGDNPASETQTASDASGDDSNALDVHFTALQRGMQKYRKEIARLQRANKRLQAEVDKLTEAEDVSIQPRRGKSGGPNAASLQTQVRKLRAEMKRLEAARSKDKKRIKKLKSKEIEADAKDLNDELEHGVTDTNHEMRKYLRRLQELMPKATIGDDEECAVCMEKLECGTCSSLTCGHIYCNDCLAQINPGSFVFPCPDCREPCHRDDLVVVTFTAEQQWDQMTAVLNEFAKIDRRHEIDTDEEEAEENFIDDAENTSSALSAVPSSPPAVPEDVEPEPAAMSAPPRVERLHMGRAVSSDDLPIAGDPPPVEDPSPASDPPPAEDPPTPYAKSPISMKRKRMQDLAAHKAAEKERKRRLF